MKPNIGDVVYKVKYSPLSIQCGTVTSLTPRAAFCTFKETGDKIHQTHDLKTKAEAIEEIDAVINDAIRRHTSALENVSAFADIILEGKKILKDAIYL